SFSAACPHFSAHRPWARKKHISRPAGVTIKPDAGNKDDTSRIQKAIDSSTGEVFFEAGTYQLTRPLRLKSARSYRGEGRWDPRYGSVLIQQTPGEAVFTFDGTLGSVTISGPTFV